MYLPIGLYLEPLMTPKKKPYTVKLDLDLLAALKAIKDRDGISESEQIRRGIRMWLAIKEGDGSSREDQVRRGVRMWLASKDVIAKSPHRRAQTRRKG